ncbi:MAG TPA: S8 family serine peptidase [Pilimelia sp.]|nr:S8 family serine peptidase [Pilimelia sp.]
MPKNAAADTLGSHDMDLLAQAEAKGEASVVLIVATDDGKAADVAAGMRKLGGSVAKQVDKVGYVRARVPTSAVLKAAKLPGVTAVDLNETIKLPDPQPESKPGARVTSQATVAGPGPGTPAANPFMPTNETGAVAFKKSHPTWDGRGVTIGVLDTGVDLDNPALQTTSTGERKIVDWVTATDPLFDGDLTWRAMLTDVTGPTFTLPGIGTYTAPAGTFKFNRFSESATAGAGSEFGGDVNRDGDTTDRWGILYDPANNNIWVDVDQDFDFTDEALMRPYKERFDVGHFGVDNPATAVRDQVPFVVEFREDVDVTPAGLPGVADFVNIGIVSGAHGSHVAGIAAGNNLLGNANLDGAAPGAKVVSARACMFAAGCTAAALTDGMVDLVVNRGVHVVNMSIGGLPALNDGNNARAQLYNRLIDDFGVQMFLSAGNSGPGLNTIGDPSVATKVMSVAASVSKETWLSNYGSVVNTKMSLFNFSSRGPREDGGDKPDIAAPGSAISTTPVWQAGSPVPEAGYSLPPGYAMFNGTSMASPQSAGAAALLLSAAKATSRTVTPDKLRRAIVSSAKWISGTRAYGQGSGLFHVPGAWDLLKGNVQIREYTVDAPVCTPISQFLATPHRGTGVYNRCAAAAGGHAPGQAKSYAVTVTRTTGPAGNRFHKISWLGNDGTFKAPAGVTLPLNLPITFTIIAKPTAGAHGAILRLNDAATSTVDFEFMNVVVAARTPVAPAWTFSTSGSVDRNAYKSFFVTVPEGAAALQVNLSGIAAGSQTRWLAINPFGVPVESSSSLVCYTNFSDPATCNPTSRSYANPLPGVWEFEVESRRTSPVLSNPFSLTARIQGVTVEPPLVELPSVTQGVPSPVSWTVTNQFGPVNVSGRGGPLGSSFTARPTIADAEHQTFEVVVPAGATRLTVTIGNPSDLAADLDLFVRRSNGALVGQSADGDSEESVTVANPVADVYTVEVDGFEVPAGTTAYDYLDVFFSPALGSVDVAGAVVPLGPGASTTINGTVTALAAPPAGRKLFGEMAVVTDEGAVVGTGAVSIGSVTTP